MTSLRGVNPSDGDTNDPNGKVCVFTILFGSFDTLLPPPKGLTPPTVDFYVMTDKAGSNPPAPWKEYVVSPLPYADNSRKNARSFKMVPPDELWNKCDIDIQVDANIDFLRSPWDLARELQPQADLGLVRHPFLSNYQSEIDHLCQIYPSDCNLYQSHAHAQEGFDPIRAHQYETSFLIRRHNNRTKQLMEAWRDDLFQSGHLRDQVALAPMLHFHNADVELFGPRGKLLISPPRSMNTDPAEYTKHLQHGVGTPTFIQVYKGHNHDFAKWRCHGKVMGKQRSSVAHSAYCTTYYVTKRFFPWVEQLAPVSYNAIKAMDLKDPVKASLAAFWFVVFAYAVFSPQSVLMLRIRALLVSSRNHRNFLKLARYEQFGKIVMEGLRYSILAATCIGALVSYFYTGTMAVACLWAGTVVLLLPILGLLLCRSLYQHRHRWYARVDR